MSASDTRQRAEAAKKPTGVWWQRSVARVLALPRLVRIILIGLFSGAVVLAVFPLIDRIYFYNFFSPDTRAVPAYILAGIGLVYYALGWWLVIGRAGTRPAVRAATSVYLLTGLIMLLIDFVLIAQGLLMQLPDAALS